MKCERAMKTMISASEPLESFNGIQKQPE